MHLPPCIPEEGRAMRVQRVARDLALRPVAHVVQPDHPERAGHADQGAEIDHRVLDDARRREAAVDEQPVEAERMAEAEGHGRQSEEYGDGARRRAEGCEGQGAERHGTRPQRAGRRPAHASVDRRGRGIGNEAIAGKACHHVNSRSSGKHLAGLRLQSRSTGGLQGSGAQEAFVLRIGVPPARRPPPNTVSQSNSNSASVRLLTHWRAASEH